MRKVSWKALGAAALAATFAVGLLPLEEMGGEGHGQRGGDAQ